MLSQNGASVIDLLPVELFNKIADGVEERRDLFSVSLVSRSWYHRLVAYIPIQQRVYLLSLFSTDPMGRLAKEPRYIEYKGMIQQLSSASGFIKTYSIVDRMRPHAQSISEQFSILDKVGGPVADDGSERAILVRKAVEAFAAALYPDTAQELLKRFLPKPKRLNDLSVKIALSYCSTGNADAAGLLFYSMTSDHNKSRAGVHIVDLLLKQNFLPKAIKIAKAIPDQIARDSVLQRISAYAVQYDAIHQLVFCCDQLAEPVRSQLFLASVIELLNAHHTAGAVEVLSKISIATERYYGWAYVGDAAIREQQFDLLDLAKAGIADAPAELIQFSCQVWSDAYLCINDLDSARDVALTVSDPDACAHLLTAIGRRYIEQGLSSLVDSLAQNIEDPLLLSQFWTAMGWVWSDLHDFKSAFMAINKNIFEESRFRNFKELFLICMQMAAYDIARSICSEETNPSLKEWSSRLLSRAEEQEAV